MKDMLEVTAVMLALASPFLVALTLRYYFAYKSEITKQPRELKVEVAEFEIAGTRCELTF